MLYLNIRFQILVYFPKLWTSFCPLTVISKASSSSLATALYSLPLSPMMVWGDKSRGWASPGKWILSKKINILDLILLNGTMVAHDGFGRQKQRVDQPWNINLVDKQMFTKYFDFSWSAGISALVYVERATKKPCIVKLWGPRLVFLATTNCCQGYHPQLSN